MSFEVEVEVEIGVGIGIEGSFDSRAEATELAEEEDGPGSLNTAWGRDLMVGLLVGKRVWLRFEKGGGDLLGERDEKDSKDGKDGKDRNQKGGPGSSAFADAATARPTEHGRG